MHHHYGKRYPSHPKALYPFLDGPQWFPLHCIGKCKILALPQFFVFYGILQTILVAFSMKTLRVCTSMWSSENDDFKFLKTTKTRKSKCITCTIVSGLVYFFISLKQLSETRNMNVKVAIKLYNIFSKISKFRYW